MIIRLNAVQKAHFIEVGLVTSELIGITPDDHSWDQILLENFDWDAFPTKNNLTIRLRNKRDHSKTSSVKMPFTDSLKNYLEETKSQGKIYNKKEKQNNVQTDAGTD